jgi:hypothetical protein
MLMILLKELFSPFGKRKRLRFFVYFVVCDTLGKVFNAQLGDDYSSPLSLFFMALYPFVFWIFLVNGIKRIRDMKFRVSYCLSEWGVLFLFSALLCLVFVPSSEID